MNKKLLAALLAVGIVSLLAWFLLPSGTVPTDADTLTDAERSDVERSAPSGSGAPSRDGSTDEATLVSSRPTLDRTDGYIGPDACQECHQDAHQSWHTSYHRTMTQPVTPETAPEVIQDRTVTVQGKTYKFSRDGDAFFVELKDPIADDRLMKRRLVLMTGSHHMQVFWYESGLESTPAQLQIMYYIDQQRWIPRRSAFLRPPSMEKETELGRWNGICCNCHTTHPRSQPDSHQYLWDTRVSDFGITCEACHGPAEAHVAFHRRGDRPDASAADPIIQPRDLPSNKQSDVCGQCHGMMMISIDNEKEQQEYFTRGRRFRPGDDLEEAHFLRVVRASEEFQDSETFRRFDAHPGVTIGHFWSDGEVRVTGRDYSSMIESKCFQEGDLSCLSCHTMHQQDRSLQAEWKDDQLKPNMRTDQACLQCHPKYEEMGTAHTHHPIESAGSRCMNCHMPHTIYGILKTSRSHTITSPSVAATVETGRPNACNLCHLDDTLEQTATHLNEWYGQPKPALSDEQKSTAASVLHFLTGDAAQRVLQVNAFQWKPAQEASGTDWMRLYLLLGMEDPYDAIRLISERGYKSLPDAPPLDYDFTAPPEKRGEVLAEQYQKILRQRLPVNEALLTNPQGFLDQRRLEALMNRRNHRPVYLQE